MLRLFLPFSLKMRRLPPSLSVSLLNPLNLCALLYLKQMCSGFPVLDFLMQFPDIMCYRQQNTLPFYIRFSTVSESSKACILFQISKASSDWILRLTRSSIPSSLVILSRSFSRYWLNFRETYKFFILSSNGTLLWFPLIHSLL